MPRPPQVGLWSFDLENGRPIRVTCDVGYLCANFSLSRPLCSRLIYIGPTYATDRRQTHIRGRDLTSKHTVIRYLADAGGSVVVYKVTVGVL